MSDTHDLSNQTSVQIDSEAIRRIREDKRLTQLYVSKVVGVTTDTVSRWENNRYPTIRKDNALKLAEALEVDLQMILQQPEEDLQPGDEDVSGAGGGKKHPLRMVIGCGIGIALVMIAWFLYINFFTAIDIRATRYLPPFAAPGSAVLIRVKVESGEAMKIILREEIPAGWEFLSSYPAASRVDPEHGAVRWILKHSPQQKHIYYRLQVSSEGQIGDTVSIMGGLVANNNGHQTQVNVTSDGVMKMAPFHWADSDRNYVIDDMEILSVSDFAEEAGDDVVGWDQLELLWESGHYRWDQSQKQFVP